jgi:hypothetical protein
MLYANIHGLTNVLTLIASSNELGECMMWLEVNSPALCDSGSFGIWKACNVGCGGQQIEGYKLVAAIEEDFSC